MNFKREFGFEMEINIVVRIKEFFKFIFEYKGKNKVFFKSLRFFFLIFIK